MWGTIENERKLFGRDFRLVELVSSINKICFITLWAKSKKTVEKTPFLL